MIKAKYIFVRFSLIAIIMGPVLSGCIDEYWPELGAKYDNALVVDGMITDQPGPYIVKLSLTTTVDDPEYKMLSSCLVTIYDDQGTEEILRETALGIYQTSPNGIRGKVGGSYRISILTHDNKYYQSAFEKLTLPTGIDSVYSKIEYREVPDALHPDAGLQFYIDTQVAETDTNYFLWRLESTFKFNANHRIRYTFDGQFHPFQNSDTLLTCWRTASVKKVFTYSTVNFQTPVIKQFPLNYVTTETKELSVRYSLLVKQLSLTLKAYKFWKSMEDLDAESGSMFTKQPYQIRGNVIRVDDEDEPVLGYFTVAGMSAKRMFVDRPQELDFYYQPACNLITKELRTVLMTMYLQWPVLLAGKVTEYGYAPGLTAKKWCVDCTQEYSGATVNEPSFWDD